MLGFSAFRSGEKRRKTDARSMRRSRLRIMPCKEEENKRSAVKLSSQTPPPAADGLTLLKVDLTKEKQKIRVMNRRWTTKKVDRKKERGESLETKKPGCQSTSSTTKKVDPYWIDLEEAATYSPTGKPQYHRRE